MSNRVEILEEYRQATSELSQLKRRERREPQIADNSTQDGDRIHYLSNKCAQLDMILEAMDASED